MKVASLHIYPIKSLGGISLRQSHATYNGLQYDRQWMLVDEEGAFVTQRKHPKMALFDVSIKEDRIHCTYNDNDISFEVNETLTDVNAGSIWQSKVKLQEVNQAVSQWFSDALSINVRLVKMASGFERKRYSHKLASPFTTLFADGYPYLILSRASLQGLNGKLENPVNIDRFRANIVIDSCGVHEEDQLPAVKIGEAKFAIAKPCARCILINTNQQTAERLKEPLATLSTYRKVGSKVNFGVNALVTKEGVICVGDEILT